MVLYPVALFIIGLASLTFSFYILYNDPQSSLNKSYFLFSSLGSYWALLSSFRHISTDLTAILFWNKSIFLWPFVITACANFLLIFIERNDLRENFYVKTVLIGPAIILSGIWLFTDYLTTNVVKEDWGWRVNVDLSTPIPALIVLWGLTIVSIIFFLGFKYYRTLESKKAKNQTQNVLISILILIGFIVVSEVGFKLFDLHYPPLTTFGFALTSIMIAYSMLKFKLFKINPEIAAREIISSMRDALFLLSPNGTIHLVNNSTLRLLGYQESKELIGKNFQELVYDKYQDRVLRNLVYLSDKEFKSYLVSKSGSIIPVSIKSTAITENDGSTVNALVLLCSDITIELKIEEERILAEKNRKELEKRRIDFITMTSHELRTPLTSIKGFTEFIFEYKNNKEDKALMSAFKAIDRNVLRLERLIDGVLDISQIDEQQFRIIKRKVELFSFLREIIDPYLTQYGSSISYLPNSTENQNLYVNIDQDRISQVVTNLIDNSFKNSPRDNGKVEIEIEKFKKSVKILIRDQGAGIASENLEKIFHRFVSIPTKFSVKGSGIGLYVSRTLIEAHGGTLTASSPGLDRGSIFIIELPLT